MYDKAGALQGRGFLAFFGEGAVSLLVVCPVFTYLLWKKDDIYL